MLGEVVVDADRVLAVVAEELAHRAAGVGGDVQDGRGVGGGGGDHDRVVHRPELLEGADHLRDRGLLLADGDVDADDALALLVDDRVHRHRGLAGLAVADDELALAAADGDHRVDGLEAGLERLLHRLAVHDAGGDRLDRVARGGRDRALPVDRLAERVHHAADEGVSHGHGHDPPGALDGVALADLVRLAEQHRAHRVLLEVERQAHDPVGQLEELPRHAVLEAVDAGDAVPHAEHGADLGHVDVGGEPSELLAEDPRDLVGANLHAGSFLGLLVSSPGRKSPGWWRRDAASGRRRCVRTVPS